MTSVSVDQSGAFAPLAAPLVCDDVVEVGDTESPRALDILVARDRVVRGRRDTVMAVYLT